MAQNYVKPIKLGSLNSAGFTGVNQQLTNAGGLEQPVIYFKITNASNVPITISYDNVNDHDYIPANTIAVFNLQTNKLPNNFVAELPRGQIIYARGNAGGGNAGFVWLSGFYIPQGV